MQVNPYLSFSGQCEAAFQFYSKILGGEIASLMRYRGSPMESEVPEDWGDKVMHGELKLGEQTLMASDCAPSWYKPAQGTSLSIGVKDPAEAERVFNALAENGTITLPIKETFWATRFGTVTDQFGIPWMIGCDKS